MSIPKTNWQERTQQNHGLIGDFASHPSQYLGNQQGWNMGIRVQAPIMDAVPLQQNFRPDKSCSSIMKSFESPASAFSATERFMGFQQYDCQGGSPSLSSQYSKSYDSQAHAHHPAAESYSIDSAEQADHSFEPKSYLRSGAKSHFSSDHYYKSLDKSHKGQCISVLGSRYHPYERNKLTGNDAAGYLQSPLAVPFQASQDHRDGRNPYGSSFAQLGFSCQQDKLSPRFSSVGVSSGNSVPNGAVLASKTRIRWTQDLHEKFVECVNCLGGAEKATPKAILKLMDSDGLTIFHVKSHLQKYRIAKYMPDPSEGKAEKRTSMNDVSPLDVKTGLQLREALQLQLDVQRRLHEQLEIQRNLQLRIEEQGRKLKMMFDQHQKSSLFKNQNSDVSSLDETAFVLEDFEVSNAGGSNNTLFPSKIS